MVDVFPGEYTSNLGLQHAYLIVIGQEEWLSQSPCNRLMPLYPRWSISLVESLCPCSKCSSQIAVKDTFEVLYDVWLVVTMHKVESWYFTYFV